MEKTDSEEGGIEYYARTPASKWGLRHQVTVLEGPGPGRLWGRKATLLRAGKSGVYGRREREREERRDMMGSVGRREGDEEEQRKERETRSCAA